MKEKYCISVDWLQVCCFCNLLEEGEYKSGNWCFTLQMQAKETAVFKRMLKVYRGTLEVATITQEPRSSALKKGLTLVKLSNRVLYSEKYIELLYALISACDMRYKGITRIDICYDCNKFYDGRNPAKFVRDFVFKNPQTKGGVYRRGSDSFTCHGARSNSSQTRITSISFGSRNNRIRSYMYDKTIELEEVKDKPWIRETWEKNGLVSDGKTHVWRAEISIKSEGQDVLNMSTGELFRLSPKYLEHYASIEKLFHYYACKVFDFRINTGQKNRRHFKPLFLFNTEIDITCKPVYISTSHDTGRMERICYNKLEKLSQTYVDLAEQERYGLKITMNFLAILSGIKRATIQQEEYCRYLDSFKADRFMSSLDYAYMDAINRAQLAKQEIDENYIYETYINQVMEAIEQSSTKW